MNHREMMGRIRNAPGFIAALDQSGGSTLKTLSRYGLRPDAWSSDAEMFELIHRMRCRILASPAFRADKVLAAILFERTMTGLVGEVPVPSYLHAKGIVPFLKVDQGLQPEADGVQLMKPIDRFDRMLARARDLGIFGTKARSVIRSASPAGIAAIVRQQFELADRVEQSGLLPILEPEYDITAPDRARGELILQHQLLVGLDGLAGDRLVVLKLSIPAEANLYRELARHPRVARLAALSGGYGRQEACAELSRNVAMIASFSRALLQDLRVWMTDEQFDAALGQAIDEIYRASTHASG